MPIVLTTQRSYYLFYDSGINSCYRHFDMSFQRQQKAKYLKFEGKKIRRKLFSSTTRRTCSFYYFYFSSF